MKRKGSDAHAILREAQAVADRYARASVLVPRRRFRLPAPVFAALGAAAAAGVWVGLHLLSVL